MKKYFIIIPMIVMAMISLNLKAGDLLDEPFSTSSSWFSNFPYNYGITWSQGTNYTCIDYDGVIYFGSSSSYLASKNITIPIGSGVTVSFDSKKASGYSYSPEIYYRIGGYSSFSTSAPTSNGWVKLGTVTQFNCSNVSFDIPAASVGGQIISICVFGKNTSSTNWWALDNFSLQSISSNDSGDGTTTPPNPGDLLKETFDYSFSYTTNIPNTNMSYTTNTNFSCGASGALYTTSSDRYLATKGIDVPTGSGMIIEFKATKVGSPSGGKVYYKEGAFVDPGLYPPSAGWTEVGSILYAGCTGTNKIILGSSTVGGKNIRILIFTSNGSYFDNWGIDDLIISSFTQSSGGGSGTTTPPVTLMQEPFSKVSSFAINTPNCNMTYSTNSLYSCDSLGSYYSTSSYSYCATKSISIPTGKAALITCKTKKGIAPTGKLYYKTGSYVTPSTNPILAGWTEVGNLQFQGCSTPENFLIPANTIGGQTVQFLFYANYASLTDWWSIDDIKIQATDSVAGSNTGVTTGPTITGTLLSEQFSSSSTFISNFSSLNGVTWSQGTTYTCSSGNGLIYFSSSDAYITTKSLSLPTNNGAKISFKLNKASGYTSNPDVYVRVGGYSTFTPSTPTNNGWTKIGSANTFDCNLNTFYLSSDLVGGQNIAVCIHFKNSSTSNWVGIDDLNIESTLTTTDNTPTTYYEPFSTNVWPPASNAVKISYHTYSSSTNAYVFLSSGGNKGTTDYYASLTSGYDISNSSSTNIITTEINTKNYSNGELRFGFKAMYPCGSSVPSYTYNEDYTFYCPKVSIDSAGKWVTLPVKYYFPNGTWKFASIDISKYKINSTKIKFENTSSCSIGVDDIKVLDRQCLISNQTCGTITGPSIVSTSGTNYTFSVPSMSGANYYKWYVRKDGTLYDIAPFIVAGQGTTTVTINFGTTAGSYRVICIPYDESPLANDDACYAAAAFKNISTSSCVPPSIINNPSDITKCPTQNTSFTLTAVEAISYQWQVNTGSGFINISDNATYNGSTTQTLLINNLSLAMSGYTYRCITKGNCGDSTISAIAKLTVSSTMNITQQPVSVSKCSSESASFTAIATNVASYQWQVDMGSGYTNVLDTGIYSGASTTTLKISNLKTNMNGYKYRCQITGNCNPTISSNVATLTVNAKPSFDLGSNLDICMGTNVTLMASGGGTYLWSNNATTQSITVNPSVTTTYKVTVTGTTGCTASDDVTINIKTFPTASAGIDKTICKGQSTTLSATGGLTYKWSTGSSLQKITVSPSVTTTYKVTVNISVFCSATDDVIVYVNAPIKANAGPDKTICQGSSTTLTGSGGETYKWNTGATTATIKITPNNTSIYTLTVTQGACTASDLAIVLVYSSPEVDAGLNKYVCRGESTTLYASGAFSYKWNTGSSSSFITVAPYITTTYTVTGKNLYGCSASDNVIVYTLYCKEDADNNQTSSVNQKSIDNNNINVSIYPNPGNGIYNCEIINNNSNKVNIKVMNILGVKIYERNINKNISLIKSLIDIHEFPDGMYIIEISNENQKIVKHLIKN